MKHFLIYLIVVLVSMASVPLIAAQEQCPGAPAPRLVIEQDGRVLPGDSNNLRDQPDRNGVRLGSIPGGASFHVLAGPTCADLV